MADIFGELEGAETVASETAVVEKETGKAAMKKEDQAKLVDAFKQALNEEGFKDKLCSLSPCLEVTNTLGYGTTGGLIHDKEASKKAGKRKVAPTSEIVGLIFKNIGKTPIQYTTEVYKANEEGIFVGEQKTMTAKPGESFQLRMKYAALLGAQTEFSNTFANAKLIGGKLNGTSLDEVLESFHISFTKDANGVAKYVHSDEVKIPVDKAGDEKVTKEFLPTFGYLMNPAPRTASGSKREKNSKYSRQELTANYVRMLASGQASL